MKTLLAFSVLTLLHFSRGCKKGPDGNTHIHLKADENGVFTINGPCENGNDGPNCQPENRMQTLTDLVDDKEKKMDRIDMGGPKEPPVADANNYPHHVELSGIHGYPGEPDFPGKKGLDRW